MSSTKLPNLPSKQPGKKSGDDRTNYPPGPGKTPPPAPKPATPSKPKP